jgi:hypothetical protein
LVETPSSITIYRFPIKENKLPFPFPSAANKWKFTVTVFYLPRHGDMEIRKHGEMEMWRRRDLEIWTWKHQNGKPMPRQFFLILLPFAHRENGSLSFVCLLTKKQTEVILLQTD